MLEQIPGAYLAFVGDGPSRKDLEKHFAGMPNVKFMVRPLPFQTVPVPSNTPEC